MNNRPIFPLCLGLALGLLVAAGLFLLVGHPAQAQVQLVSFSAVFEDGSVRLAWETSSEINTLGFNLYRAGSPGGARTRLNDNLIPTQSLGSDTGARYEFVDRSVAPGMTYYYWLESVDVYGQVSSHGPVTATTSDLPRTCWARVASTDSDYATVQAAVDAAEPGDLVQIAGTCQGVEARGGLSQTVYVNKTLTLRGGYTTTDWTVSAPVSNPTTLDARGGGRVLYVKGKISATIEGLGITGGDAAGLGGGPSDQDAGGGLYVLSATVSLEGNQVFSNSAESGGGILLGNSSDVVLRANTIADNSASAGGGLYLWASTAALEDNTIAHNRAEAGGGGMWLLESEATLRANTIAENEAKHGGGVGLGGSTATLGRNVVASNRARNVGGGLHMVDSEALLVNSSFTSNEAITRGGGIYVLGASLQSLHTTLADNKGGDGSGIFVNFDDWRGVHSRVALTNCIVASHTVGISVTGGNTVTMNGILWDSTVITVAQSPTATVVVQNQLQGDSALMADGVHIAPASAALDMGVDAGLATDVDGHHRPYGTAPDLGADELVATTVSREKGGTLVYSDTQTLPTTVEVPAEAVTETITLVYTPTDTATPSSGFFFAGRAFELDAYREGVLVPGLAFDVPVSVTLHYAEADWAGMEEASLRLLTWMDSAWQDAACGAYDRHPDENWLSVPICHLSQFALFGRSGEVVYLPVVLRGGP